MPRRQRDGGSISPYIEVMINVFVKYRNDICSLLVVKTPS